MKRDRGFLFKVRGGLAALTALTLRAAMATSVAGCNLIIDIEDIPVLPAEGAASGASCGCDGDGFWSRCFVGPEGQVAMDMATDPAGNVLLTGSFRGALSFGGETLVSAGEDDIFVVKLSQDGEHVWSRRFGSAKSEQGTAIATDEQGAVYVAGDYSQPFDFGDGVSGSALSAPFGESDYFLVKLSSSGKIVWVASDGLSADDHASDVVYNNERVFVTGASTTETQVFLHRYTDGIKSVDGQEIASAVTKSPKLSIANAGVCLTGSFTKKIDFDTPGFVMPDGTSPIIDSKGAEDVFAARYELIMPPTHKDIWSRTFGDANSQTARAIASEGSQIVLAGSLWGSIDFGAPEDDGAHALTSSGEADVFVAKLEADVKGARTWSKRFGDKSTQEALSVAVRAGRVIVGGRFYGSMIFEGGASLKASGGGSDIFVLELSSEDGSYISGQVYGDGESQAAQSVAVAEDGDVFVAGSFFGSVDFGCGSALVNKTASEGIFVAKLPAK
jgi:hypothetical protein